MFRHSLLLLLAACADTRSAQTDACALHKGARDVQVGQFHSCALLCDGSVRCWGDNSFGQLGLGDRETRGDAPGELGPALPAVDLGVAQRAIGLALGTSHSCALLEHGAVKCWGANASGELGLGDRIERGSERRQMGDALAEVALGSARVAAIAAGGSHTCALFDSGKLKCWGANYSGELGLGDTAVRGDDADDMGSALGYIDLGAAAVVVQVVAGQNHTCARLQDGRVKCWGDNGAGRLGLGDAAKRGDAAGEMGDALPALALGREARVEHLAAHGGSHSCALLRDGRVKCWGENNFGALGVGDARNRGADPTQLGDALPSVELAGLRATSIEAGSAVTCTILSDRSTRCWGYNQYAALGTGDTRNRGDTPGNDLSAVQLGANRYAIAVRPSSGNHTCALLDDGSIKCWGGNGQGQLGQGHGDTLGDDPSEMGDSLSPLDLRATP